MQNSTFVRTTEKKIQAKLGKVKSDLREDWRFEDLAPIGSHINGNEKKKKIIKR